MTVILSSGARDPCFSRGLLKKPQSSLWTPTETRQSQSMFRFAEDFWIEFRLSD